MKLLKKTATLLFALAFSLLLATAAAAAEPVQAENFNLMINGDSIEFGENVPLSIDDRTLLPLSFVFEKLGGDDLNWDDEARVATLTRGENVLKLWIDTGEFELNGQSGEQTVATTSYNDYAYVPLAFIADAFDMSVYWNESNATAYIADNAKLEQIVALMNSKSVSPDEIPAMKMKVVADIELAVSVNGEALEDGSGAMTMQGTIIQDYANKFQHVTMELNAPDGEAVTTEVYDDGVSQYAVVDETVVKTESAFSLAEGLLDQYSVVSGLDLDSTYYAGLKLTETNDTYTLSGELFIPEDYFDELLSGMAGMEGVAAELEGMTMRIAEPLQLSMTAERETGLPTSMKMNFAMDMSMPIDGTDFAISVKYNLDVSEFEYGIEIDRTIPQEILDAAVEM